MTRDQAWSRCRSSSTRDTTIYFEAAGAALPASESGINEASGAGEAATRVVDAGGDLAHSIAKLCEKIMNGFDGIEDRLRPVSATVEFTVAVSIEGNIKVVKGAAEAGVKVTAQWGRSPSADE